MLVDYANKFGKKFGAKVEDRAIRADGRVSSGIWQRLDYCMTTEASLLSSALRFEREQSPLGTPVG